MRTGPGGHLACPKARDIWRDATQSAMKHASSGPKPDLTPSDHYLLNTGQLLGACIKIQMGPHSACAPIEGRVARRSNHATAY